MTNPLESLADEMRKVRTQMKEIAQTKGKPLILEALQPVFDLGAGTVRWRQYTPYFNDGEPCEFSVHDPNVYHTGLDSDGGDYEDGFYDSWTLKYYSEKGHWVNATLTADEIGALADALAAFGSAICNNDIEPFMEDLFGDHVEVLVHSDGTIVVDDYDHD